MLYKFALPLSALSAASAVSAAPLPENISITNDLTFASEYVFRGIEFADRSFQPTLELELDDFYAGLWANLPIETQQSELNYYGGYNFEVPEVPLTFDAGLTVYHFPDAGAERTHELYFGATAEDVGIPGLHAGAYYFFDMDLHSHVGEASLGYDWDLAPMNLSDTSLGATLHAGLQGQTKNKTQSYNYYGGSLELAHALNEAATATAGAHYATAEKYDFGAGERGKNLFWTLSLATSF